MTTESMPYGSTTDDHPQTSKKKRLGILQAGRIPEELTDQFSDYDQMFVEFLGPENFSYRHYAVLDDQFPQSASEADSWLITGSRHAAYEQHSWIAPLEQLIRDIYELGLPMVGICFGHQIIATALGGTVEKFDKGWCAGYHQYQLDESVFGTSTETGQTPLLAFHQDQVIEPPSEAVTIGRSSFCRHAALLYDKRILTLQPHPEFSQDFVDGLLRTRGSVLPPDVHKNARENLHKPVDQLSVAQTLRQFLQQGDPARTD